MRKALKIDGRLQHIKDIQLNIFDGDMKFNVIIGRAWMKSKNSGPWLVGCVLLCFVLFCLLSRSYDI